MSKKNLLIRNSTAEFLIFQAQSQANGVEVMYADETIWCTQDAIATLFDKSRSTITEHLQNIFEEGELVKDSVCRKFRRTASDGKEYNTQFYNLDAIISVGYRANSTRATQFRQWATAVLRQFAIRGYVLDKKRMENGVFLTEDYFEHLLAEIREIRLSERRMYQKVTDLYATAIDYNKDAPTTRKFFAKVQNKMHYAIHGHTAAELIVERANAEKEHMGLTTWENAPDTWHQLAVWGKETRKLSLLERKKLDHAYALSTTDKKLPSSIIFDVMDIYKKSQDLGYTSQPTLPLE